MASGSTPIKNIVVSGSTPKKKIVASGSTPIKNIVLVGRAGNGKSATANSIVGERMFTSGAQATGVTMTCQTFRVVTEDLHCQRQIINVIDTPGLFDLSKPPEYISKEIIRCLALVDEGLHALVLVLTVRTRMTQEEESVVSTLQSLFGARILNYMIVVFTGGDELQENNQTLETYLATCPEFLTRIFALCDNRTVLFTNRHGDEDTKKKQIQQLLAHVATIGRNNAGRPFTEEMHRQIREETRRLREDEKKANDKVAAEREIQKEIKTLRESYDRSMASMSEIVERTMRDAWDSHQASMRLMETVVTARREQDIAARPVCNIM